jgi:hypothetical protein
VILLSLTTETTAHRFAKTLSSVTLSSRNFTGAGRGRTLDDKMGFGGTYQRHVLTSGCSVCQALFRVVHPGKDRYKLFACSSRGAGLLVSLAQILPFQDPEIMRGFEFESLRHILHCVLPKTVA